MLLMIIISFFSLTVQASGISITDVCTEKAEENRIVKPLERVGKEEWCLLAVCNNNKETVERQVCVSQDGKKESDVDPYKFKITQRDLYSTPGASGSRGSLLGSIEIYKTDACFDICKPEEKKTAFSGKAIFGRDKPACLECIIKRPREGDTYELLGKGITVYKGQQCYYKCKPVGRENDMPVYSQQCLDCVGSGSGSQKGGKPLAAKIYIISDGKVCFEIIEGEYGKVWNVPMELCKKADKVYGTVYKRASSYNVKTLLWGEKPACMELDDFSYGGYLKREVMDYRCPDVNVKDDDRSTGKDVQQKGGKGSSSSGATRN